VHYGSAGLRFFGFCSSFARTDLETFIHFQVTASRAIVRHCKGFVRRQTKLLFNGYRMKIANLEQLLEDELKDIYSAEN
jgi:hypothetical protein